VLADILDLKQYDDLEDRAKEEAKERKLKAAERENQVARIDAELLLKPAYVKSLEEVEADITQKQAVLAALREELQALHAREQDLQSSERRLAELQTREHDRITEMVDAQARIQQNSARQADLETLLSQRAEIECGFKELQAAVAEERRFSDSISSLLPLQDEQAALQRKIDEERMRLSGEQRQHEAQVRDLQARLAGREKIQRQLDNVLTKLDEMTRLQERHEDTKCKKEALDVSFRSLSAEKDACETEGNQLAQKLDLLSRTHAEGNGHVGCPLCGTDLQAEALQRVQRSFESDIAARRQEFVAKRKELEGVKREMVGLEALIAKEREQLKPLAGYQEDKARYMHTLASLDDDLVKLDSTQALLLAVSNRLSGSDYALDARQELAGVEARIAGLAYNKEDHAAARRKLHDLEAKGYAERYHSLESAGSELATVLASIEADRKRLGTWTRDQQSDLTEIAVLQPQVEQLEVVSGHLRDRGREASDLSAALDALLGRRGDLRGKIAHCEALQEEKQRVLEEYELAVQEKGIYDQLALAFGKNGIQAMIIENVIPEIEDEANSLLDRMTNGRMSVHIATQRDSRNGKSVIETLAINISDEVGTRAYELYSGGEAFRINFALRIALSKLLARRAGAQLQMLVIDEGFGTQDGQGRDKLVGAIRSIQEDFEKVLVVTHIEELKGEFPVRIDVIKTESGSYIVNG
jgi:exonuclease SbcC